MAGVRRLVLDDGQERGVRLLHFDTGGGLSFWVTIDRALDLAGLWWRGIPFAWQAPAGFRSPSLHAAEAEGWRGLMRSFGGLLVTCGLDHIRQPKDGQPLHGRLPFTPARLTAYGEDWEREEPVLYAEGEIVQARLGGEHLRLRRRIEAPVGGNLIRLRDEVVNRGAEPVRQAMLYHINLGFPALATGSRLMLDDELLAGPLTLPRDGAAVGRMPCGGRPRMAARDADDAAWAIVRSLSAWLRDGEPAVAPDLARSAAGHMRLRHRALHQRPAAGRDERGGDGAGARCGARLRLGDQRRGLRRRPSMAKIRSHTRSAAGLS